MNKSITALSAALVLGGVGCHNNSASDTDGSESSKPNFIIMLLDDAGYNDFGFMGSQDILTPNIDRLAANGVVFTDAHVSATVCGPSRAGLLTGRYQQRFGFECNPPAEFSGLPPDEITMAEMMKTAGYQTAAFGKWHLGHDPEDRPNQRGFDYFWGFLAGSRGYFTNDTDDTPGSVHSIRKNDEFTTFDGYLTDVLGDKLVEYVDQQSDAPFFVYWAPNAPHTPMQATGEDLARFEGHPRQMLAAMMWSLDRSVGKVISKLEDEGILDNTLIFFLSDNGGAHNNQSSNYPLKGWKGNKYEAGSRIPFFVHWPKGITQPGTFDGLTSSLDIYSTCAEVAGADVQGLNQPDGQSLIPYLSGNSDADPHDVLFLRKDRMAAVRKGDYKLIRVDSLGTRLYNLADDLSETNDLSGQLPEKHAEMMSDLVNWESGLISPLWLEDDRWNKVTWMIHEDLFNNREIRVKEPAHLNQD
jgi:arylsulfatase A-like enzyme